MRIEFVNHASFIVDHRGTRVITDPWLEGTVFDNGWRLISDSQFGYADFANVDYIWFSHEHPDHFFPPNLNKIPAGVRQRLTVLFQETPDKRVVTYCRKAGFGNVVELRPGTWMTLNDDLHILCEHFREGDSWMAFKSADVTLLNTNDCGIRNTGEALRVKRKVGQVDVLLTQFSYAYWAGNVEDVELRRGIADDKLEGVKFQCEMFKPAVVIPIASFIWFCHEDNFYLNDAINTPDTVCGFLTTHTSAEPVVLYVGDRYEFPREHDNGPALARYRVDYARALGGGDLVKGASVQLSAIEEEARRFLDEVKRRTPLLLRWMLQPTHVYLSDYDAAFMLSLEGGLQPSSRAYERCDVALSSESLLCCLKYPYGTDTVQINGRMQRPTHGTYARFYNLFRINHLDSRGVRLDARYLAGMLYRKVLTRVGLYRS